MPVGEGADGADGAIPVGTAEVRIVGPEAVGLPPQLLTVLQSPESVDALVGATDPRVALGHIGISKLPAILGISTLFHNALQNS